MNRLEFPLDLKGRAMRRTANVGDRVRVQYLGLLADGTGMEKQIGRKVLEFTVGSDEVIPGISHGVIGMAEGEQRRLTLQPKDGYGMVLPGLIKEVSRKRFPSHLNLRVGERLTSIGKTSGRRRQVQIVKVDSETVVIDGNHPLAGKVLEVQVQIVSLDVSSANRRSTSAD